VALRVENAVTSPPVTPNRLGRHAIVLGTDTVGEEVREALEVRARLSASTRLSGFPENVLMLHFLVSMESISPVCGFVNDHSEDEFKATKEKILAALQACWEKQRHTGKNRSCKVQAFACPP
jgi:hypothetical protein